MMSNGPLSATAPKPFRMLAETYDGIFLWPGSQLARRRGRGYLLTGRQDAVNKFARFFGPEPTGSLTIGALDLACAHLRYGRVDPAQRLLDGLRLPSVSPNGWRVMKAVAARLDLHLPVVLLSDRQVGTACRHRAWERVGRFDKALEDINTAIRLEPDSMNFDARGELLSKLDRIEEALEDFNRAEALDPVDWCEAFGPV